MDSALGHWLALRESADTAARSTRLTQTIADVVAGKPAQDAEPVGVLDLCTGTGSNIRYLAGRLQSPQRWLGIDRDPALLALLPTRTASWGAARGYEVQAGEGGCAIRSDTLDCRIETRCLDLGPLDDPGVFSGRDLVTASALLDLVSEAWLRTLAARCRAVGAAALFTLIYDGRSSCTPEEPEDDTILELFNRHQRTDKGLGGPAAGPGAAECAVRCFAEVGYEVHRAQSDWVIEPGEREFQRQLIEGWAEAAAEMAPDRAALIAGWLARRLGHVDAGRSRVVVGHRDVAAWLPERPTFA